MVRVFLETEKRIVASTPEEKNSNLRKEENSHVQILMEEEKQRNLSVNSFFVFHCGRAKRIREFFGSARDLWAEIRAGSVINGPKSGQSP